MPAFYIRVSRESFQRLIEFAKRDRRRPQDQAAVLLEEALSSNHVPGYCQPTDGSGSVDEHGKRG
jgi:hypothetical protein